MPNQKFHTQGEFIIWLVCLVFLTTSTKDKAYMQDTEVHYMVRLIYKQYMQDSDLNDSICKQYMQQKVSMLENVWTVKSFMV